MHRWPCAFLAVMALSGVAPAQRTPAEAVRTMRTPDGFGVRCVTHEPMIRQPVSVWFDDRGRMWVLQYLQYPNYAGLKPLKQDQYLRTVWDRVPEPPPHGPKGADKITILYDPDDNGVFRRSKDFVTGLNIASGFCLGHGGVYVAQPPYLLFYPDRDGDDVPDGDPEVLLTGFGMDDTHSLANHLKWGPDGWLYGAAGSTSTSRIKNPHHPDDPVVEFQQGIWRYHPLTRKFELFSEGGGNTYGLDFDEHGQLIAGTNWGGYAMLHQMQGAYYIKGFAKHGPLHNPHAYGYFNHVPYKNFKGGHVTCGGIVYQAEVYPPHLRNQYIAGNLLSNAVYWHRLVPHLSSFRAEHGGELIETDDIWFRPIDIVQGPDGCVYIVDWYDRRAAHLDPIDNWDKDRGRVYRLEYQSGPRYPRYDLRQKTAAELLELLKHPNKWWRNAARQRLAELRDPSVYAPLRQWIRNNNGLLALEALWALYVSGGWNWSVCREFLHHPNEHVRAWTVRLATDVPQTHPPGWFAQVGQDRSPVVLAQLACSARRMRLQDALAAVRELQANPLFEQDPQLPLLTWWAMETHISQQQTPAQWIEWLNLRNLFAHPARQGLAERWLKRLLADDLPGGAAGVATLWERIPLGQRPALVATLARALEGQTLPRVPEPLQVHLERYRAEHPNDPAIVAVLARMNEPAARTTLRQQAASSDVAEMQRLAAMNLLRQLRDPPAKDLFWNVLTVVNSERLRLAALDGLEAYDDPTIAEVVLRHYPQWPVALQRRAVQLLLSRPSWSLALLRQIDAGQLPKEHLSLEQARTAVSWGEANLTALVEKHFGKLAPATPGEKQARIAWLNTALSRIPRTDRSHGQALFVKLCASCHRLHGQGNSIGPDLTAADRKNRLYLLTHIVDPSAYIRPEYMVQTVLTHDERRISGIVRDQGNAIQLVNVTNDQPVIVRIAKQDIADIRPSPVSLMPEKLLDTLSDNDVADLLAYIMSDPPPVNSPAPPRPATPPSDASPRPASPSATASPRPLRLALVSGSFEYASDASLAQLRKLLEERYQIECVMIAAKSEKDTTLAGIERLKDCDAAIFFTRRLQITGDSLQAVKDFVASKKPILGIRTASHGFQNWLEMDKLVFGGDYRGHFGSKIVCQVRIAPNAGDHPILRGVQPFTSNGSLYKNPKLANDVTVLLTGTIPSGETEPVAWIRTQDGRRVFYTSLGHPDDFQNENFIRLLCNALEWLAGDKLKPRR